MSDDRSLERVRAIRRARRAIAGLVLFCTAAVLVLGVAGFVLVGVAGELRQARHDLGSARLGQGVGREVAAVRAGQRSALAAELAETAGERDEVYTALGSTVDELHDAQGAMVDAEGRLFLQGSFIDVLQQCLGGVSQALNASAVDDRGATVAALGAVAEACRTAEEAAGSTADPAFLFDFADPFVLAADGRYYAYSTNGGGGNVQLITADQLGQWRWVGNALPALPPWATPNRTWAPSVLATPSGFVLYYTARHQESGRQCISRAVAALPEGPFVDDSAGPLVCQLDRNGSIDPSPFVDSGGQAYLLWKSEGLTAQEPARLWSQALGPDGLSLVGAPAELLAADRGWEQGVVEGPSMVREGSRWYLFYSAASWNSAGYSVGYAVCSSPVGPCEKASTDGPLLSSQPPLEGPGGAEVFRDAGGTAYLAYHAWTEGQVGYPHRRRLHLLRLDLGTGAPVLSPAP